METKKEIPLYIYILCKLVCDEFLWWSLRLGFQSGQRRRTHANRWPRDFDGLELHRVIRLDRAVFSPRLMIAKKHYPL